MPPDPDEKTWEKYYSGSVKTVIECNKTNSELRLGGPPLNGLVRWPSPHPLKPPAKLGTSSVRKP